MTRDRLLSNILWSVWIVIGSYLEESNLIGESSEAYREYQKRVPMIVCAMPHEEALKSLSTTDRGLKKSHVELLQEEYGPNEIGREKKLGFVRPYRH
jgi:hypothetical protein